MKTWQSEVSALRDGVGNYGASTLQKKKREKIAAAPRVKLKKDEKRDAQRIQRSLCLPGVCDERASRIKNQA